MSVSHFLHSNMIDTTELNRNERLRMIVHLKITFIKKMQSIKNE